MKDAGVIRWLGGLSLLGGVSAVPIMVAFAVTGWGEPGTAEYQRYELLNRLMAVSLLFMASGWLGLFMLWPGGYGRWGALLACSGSLIMVMGTAAEFWLFSDQPYGSASNLRNAAWSAFGIGSLIMDIGALVLGVAAWRSNLWPRWYALVLLLTLPIDIAAFIFTGSPFFAAALLALLNGWRLLTYNKVPDEVGTAVP